MLILCILTTILAVGILFYSIDENHPVPVIMFELFLIVILSYTAWHIYINPIPEPKVVVQTEKQYHLMKDSIYQLGYKMGLSDCKNK
jgi:hypothetical protein